jgi:hypothetical protein
MIGVKCLKEAEIKRDFLIGKQKVKNSRENLGRLEEIKY